MAKQMPLTLLLGALVALAVTPACYTLFSHPKIRSGSVYETVENTRCLDCHERREFDQFHQLPNHAIHPGDENNDLLSIPWWYQSRWHFDSWRPATSILLPPASPTLSVASLEAGLPHPTRAESETWTRDSTNVVKGRLNEAPSKKRSATASKNTPSNAVP